MEVHVERECVILVGAAPALLSAVSPDGEVLWQVQLSPGPHDGGFYLDLLSNGATLDIEGGTLLKRDAPVERRSISPAKPLSQFDTAANPDFVGTRSTPDALAIRKQLREVQRATRDMNRAMEASRALKSAEREAEEAAERERQAEEAAEAERDRLREQQDAEVTE